MSALSIAEGRRVYNQPGKFAALERYWNDPLEAVRLQAERDERRARFNAAMAAHDAREAARREARWAAEEPRS